MSEKIEYEYGIMRSGGDVHREGMTEEQALEFIAEWLDDGGKPGVFKVIRRPVSGWELAPGEGPEIVYDEGAAVRRILGSQT